MLLRIIQGYYWSIFLFMILDYGLDITAERVINMIFAGTVNGMAYYYNKNILISKSS